MGVEVEEDDDCSLLLSESESSFSCWTLREALGGMVLLVLLVLWCVYDESGEGVSGGTGRGEHHLDEDDFTLRFTRDISIGDRVGLQNVRGAKKGCNGD
jgi:hypothetical protein